MINIKSKKVIDVVIYFISFILVEGMLLKVLFIKESILISIMALAISVILCFKSQELSSYLNKYDKFVKLINSEFIYFLLWLLFIIIYCNSLDIFKISYFIFLNCFLIIYNILFYIKQ